MGNNLPKVKLRPVGPPPERKAVLAAPEKQPLCDPSVDPDAVWKKRTEEGTIVVKEHQLATPATKPENVTRFVCISDTHSLHSYFEHIPDGDVLIHAGDFSNVGKAEDIEAFSEFLGSLPHKYKIVIAGNHDVSFDEENYERLAVRFGHNGQHSSREIKAMLKNCIYLEDQEVIVKGFRIYGSPWQPEFCDWGFNLARGEQCQEKWDLIPSGIDILITHGPPLGHGDLCSHGDRAGCVNLLDEIERRIKPKYHIFGHIHEGYGTTTNGETIFVNCSTCNVRYDRRNLNPPIVFDLPNPTSRPSSSAGGEDDMELEEQQTDRKSKEES
ncbi:Metallophosphoesterase mpped2 [Balamuthia mandrillaris]